MGQTVDLFNLTLFNDCSMIGVTLSLKSPTSTLVTTILAGRVANQTCTIDNAQIFLLFVSRLTLSNA